MTDVPELDREGAGAREGPVILNYLESFLLRPKPVRLIRAEHIEPGVELDDFGWWRKVVRVYRRPGMVEVSFGSICRGCRPDEELVVRGEPLVSLEPDDWYRAEVSRMAERAPA